MVTKLWHIVKQRHANTSLCKENYKIFKSYRKFLIKKKWIWLDSVSLKPENFLILSYFTTNIHYKTYGSQIFINFVTILCTKNLVSSLKWWTHNRYICFRSLSIMSCHIFVCFSLFSFIIFYSFHFKRISLQKFQLMQHKFLLFIFSHHITSITLINVT